MISVPPDVDDEETLHRLLNPKANAVQGDRIHYMAFWSGTDPHRISVDRARYRTTDESLMHREHCGIAGLNTGQARALDVSPHRQLEVVSLPEHGNDAHAEIQAETGIPQKRFKTKIWPRSATLRGSSCCHPSSPILDGYGSFPVLRPMIEPELQ